MTLAGAFRRLDDVREEYYAARVSLSLTLKQYDSSDGSNDSGREQVTRNHLKASIQNLQITYLTRLFAEFEGILREYWINGRRRTNTLRMVDLMNSVAAYCFINQDDTLDAHEVRDYRNDVIHEHLQDPRFDFQTSRSRLARFVRWLPQQW
jgi:hypothetical protein